MSINLALHGTSYYRFFGAAEVPQAIPDFRQVYLACYRDRMCRNVTLDDTTITYYGFTRCGAFPCVLIGNSIALSALPLADDLVVVIYTNDKDVRIRFAVALGCCRGQRWVHIVCDDTGGRSSLWEDYAKNVYERLWNARAEYARSMFVENRPPFARNIDYCVKHAHLP